MKRKEKKSKKKGKGKNKRKKDSNEDCNKQTRAMCIECETFYDLDDGDSQWIECESCLNRYHASCVGIDEGEASDVNFVCTLCCYCLFLVNHAFNRLILLSMTEQIYFNTYLVIFQQFFIRLKLESMGKKSFLSSFGLHHNTYNPYILAHIRLLLRMLLCPQYPTYARIAPFER